MVKPLLLALSVLLMTSAMAEDMACNPAATEKKLAGAAKKSFLQRCEKDAKAMCEARSAEKKLAGAAKTSSEKKCLKEAMG